MAITIPENSRLYELMVIFSGELIEKDFEKEFGELRTALKENSTGIAYEESWGKRDLTYRIKKQPRGYYVIFNFTAEPNAITELSMALKLNQAVLRHLIMAMPDNYEPGSYKKTLTRERADAEEKKRSQEKRHKEKETVRPEVVSEDKKPTLAGKEEEEKLKKVEKKLEQILDNPDIDVR